jgi:ATP-dependent Clp protease ATP-binding subunit ClpA
VAVGINLEKDENLMMRFDRFTERAQEAAQRAAEIIQRYGHNQIDTEHILLALIEQPQGVIPQILEYLKVDSNALTERLITSAPARRPTSSAAAPGKFLLPRA